MVIKVNGHLYPLAVADKFDELLSSMGMDKIANKKINELKAPMPGLVLSVVVSEGQQVKKGEAIIVLEAMKMENILNAPRDGTVTKVNFKNGDNIMTGEVIVEIE